MVSDLRGSGSIEQDADMVILLHREDVYDKESPRAGEADILIAKHRNGPTKDIVVAFQGHYSRFANMAADAGGGGGGFEQALALACRSRWLGSRFPGARPRISSSSRAWAWSRTSSSDTGTHCGSGPRCRSRRGRP